MKTTVTPAGNHGRFTTYHVKVGTGPVFLAVIKRARRFGLGQRVHFADVKDIRSTSVNMKPLWYLGRICGIVDNTLCIDFQ